MFIGADPENPHDLGGEFEIDLDGEKHIINKTSAILVPEGIISSSMNLFLLGSLSTGALNSVNTLPGPMALTQMLYRAHSVARHRVNMLSPALLTHSDALLGHIPKCCLC